MAELIDGDKEECPRQGQDNHWSSSQPPTNNPDLARPLINFEDHRFDNLTLLTTKLSSVPLSAPEEEGITGLS